MFSVAGLFLYIHIQKAAALFLKFFRYLFMFLAKFKFGGGTKSEGRNGISSERAERTE